MTILDITTYISDPTQGGGIIFVYVEEAVSNDE